MTAVSSAGGALDMASDLIEGRERATRPAPQSALAMPNTSPVSPGVERSEAADLVPSS
jgi:hypothetical protein